MIILEDDLFYCKKQPKESKEGFERADSENATFGSIFPPRRDSERSERSESLLLRHQSKSLSRVIFLFNINKNLGFECESRPLGGFRKKKMRPWGATTIYYLQPIGSYVYNGDK